MPEGMRFDPSSASWKPVPGPVASMAAVPISTPQNQPGLVVHHHHDVHEPWTGAFQQGYQPARRESIAAFGPVYACVSLITGDIAKCPIRLVEKTSDGVWVDAHSPAFSPVLRKPNRYQTRIQFLRYWMSSKLFYGNTYILKQRDDRKVVIGLYPLHPANVTPRVTDDGDIYYEIGADNLSGIKQSIPVPASEIIHDRMNAFFHPLCGIPPIYACAMTVAQGQNIQNNSSTFFSNMSRPSGILLAPGTITPEQLVSLKTQYEQAFRGVNLGRLMVASNGMTYEPMSMPAEQAQLIEQLKWTVEDCIRPFLMPPHKVGAGNPTVANAAQYNVEYYANCVQQHMEDIELLLDEGLGLGEGFGNAYGVWIDEKNLMRMDLLAQMDVLGKGTSASILAVNEARKELNYAPVEGGDEPLSQQQYWPLSILQDRPAPSDAVAPATPIPQPEEDEEETAQADMRAALMTMREGFARAA